ncbi:MAG: hypothetical protein QM756_27425 [Polyangiaceae bacterium]
MTRKPLAAGLTLGPRMVLSQPSRKAGGDFISARLACLADGCFAAWLKDGVVGRPLNWQGTPIGSKATDVFESNSVYEFKLASAGDHYWAALRAVGMPIVPVSAAGTAGAPILGLSGDRMPFLLVGSLASGDTLGVLYVNNSGATYDLVLQRVRGTALVANNDGVVVQTGGAGGAGRAALGVGAGKFAVTSDNRLTRVDATTGAILDNPPIVFAKYGYGQFAGNQAIAFDGQNFLVAWVENNLLFTTRVRASDGARLDPDDEFNQLSGARQICDIGGSVEDLRLDLVGDQLVYTWRANNQIISAVAPMAPWTSSTGACSTWGLGAAGTREPERQQVDDITFVGSKAMRVLRSTAILSVGLGARVHDFSVLPPTTAAAGYVNFTSPYRTLVGVASSGADFIVGHYDRAAESLTVSRVDDQSGGLLGDPIENSHCGSNFAYWTQSGAVASNGSGYLIGWDDGNQRCFQRIGCDGELGEIQRSAGGVPLGSLSSDGNRYLLLQAPFNPSVTRLSSTGLVEGSPISLDSGVVDWSVAADRDPDPTRRTFLLLGRQVDHVAAFRLRSATGSLLTPVTLASAAASGTTFTFAASDGSQVLGGWANASTGYASGVLIDPLSGQSKTTTPAQLPYQSQPTVTFDGATFVVLSLGATGPTASRINSNLEQLDTASVLELPYGPSATIASNLHGRTLYAYAKYDPTEQGDVIFGHFIDNVLPAAASADSSCDVKLASGGAGGVANGGSAGVAGGGVGNAAGASGVAGGIASGGSTGAAQGGASDDGGAAGAGVTGGTAAGGTLASGGTAAGGSSTGGELGSAGESAVGGSLGADGGASGAASGGSAAASGGAAAGGRAAGGATSVAGQVGATGGALSASGGASGSGDDAPSEGCSCAQVRPRRSPWSALSPALVSLLFLARRRRRHGA